MSIHLELKERIESHYHEYLQGDLQLRQDSLQVQFDSGLLVEVRYLNINEYSLQWLWGDAELRIDTAPLHTALSTFPNHFHNADEAILPDTITAPGKEPWENVRQLIDRLLQDPLLENM